MITRQQAKEWEEKNYPWKLIDSSKEKTIGKKFNFIKTLAVIFLVLIVVAFLALYCIRTYYYNFYRDITNVTHVCEPNIIVEATQCSDVNVECECMNSTELKSILDDVCPNTINIYVDDTL